MEGFKEELSRITKNFKDLFEFSRSGIEKLFNLNLGSKSIKVLRSLGSVVHWGVAAVIQLGFMPFVSTIVPKAIEKFVFVPKLFEWAGNGIITLFNANNIVVTGIFIPLRKHFIYPLLYTVSQLPLVGWLFTKAMLPWTVGTVIGVLFVSNLYQVFDEQFKVVSQQLNSLKQTNKKEYDEINGYDLVLMSDLRDNNSINAEPYKLYLSENGNYIARDLAGKVHQGILPKDIDLKNLDEKFNNPEFKSVKSKILDYTSKEGHTVKGNLLRYLQFYGMMVANTGFADANKAFYMRFALSLGASSSAFLVGCLCGIQPAIALSYAVKLSWAGWALPYGVIGALGAVHKGYASIYETWWPTDHNKARADKRALEKQEALLEQQRLDATGDRGHRLTDEPVPRSSLTNNQGATPSDLTPEALAAAKEAEKLEKRKQVLKALYERSPMPGKTTEEAVQEALRARPVPVTFTPVSPREEPPVANAGQQPDNKDKSKPSDKPGF